MSINWSRLCSTTNNWQRYRRNWRCIWTRFAVRETMNSSSSYSCSTIQSCNSSSLTNCRPRWANSCSFSNSQASRIDRASWILSCKCSSSSPKELRSRTLTEARASAWTRLKLRTKTWTNNISNNSSHRLSKHSLRIPKPIKMHKTSNSSSSSSTTNSSYSRSIQTI